MEDLLVLDFKIRSHSGSYSVTFDDSLKHSDKLTDLGTHFIIDKNVFNTMSESFILGIGKKKFILIDATEENKSYQGAGAVIEKLVQLDLKRDSKLVAIGGGITQDITCFIASTFMRGIDWVFVPTTLLAQADSCIGSKSSINFGPYKNLLGTFTPPNEVYICKKFLDTLEDKDFKSGIGEIVKLFIIGNRSIEPNEITRENVQQYIRDALLIKKRFIETDEFDQDVRQVLNYGHCFGHGIESATNFAIPHGIAITIGMDIANTLACDEGLITDERYEELHRVLYPIYQDYTHITINPDDVFPAMTKDKKNTGSKINLILPVGSIIKKLGFENSFEFWNKARKAMN
jgi:3-dehydroquinate synthase